MSNDAIKNAIVDVVRVGKPDGNAVFLQDARGKFVKGNAAGPGRPKGSRSFKTQRDRLLDMIAFDLKTGKRVWTYNPPGRFHFQNAYIIDKDRQHMYIACSRKNNKQLLNLDIKTGKPVWIYTESGEQTAKWRSLFLSQPLVYNGRVYASTEKGLLHCYEPKEKDKSKE